MDITLNGKPTDLTEGITLGELVVQLGLEAERVAIEVNEDVVPRKTFSETPVKPGDRIEIVTFVGGG